MVDFKGKTHWWPKGIQRLILYMMINILKNPNDLWENILWTGTRVNPKTQKWTRKEQVSIDSHVNYFNLTVEINIFTAWYKKKTEKHLRFTITTTLKNLIILLTHLFRCNVKLKSWIIRSWSFWWSVCTLTGQRWLAVVLQQQTYQEVSIPFRTVSKSIYLYLNSQVALLL